MSMKEVEIDVHGGYYMVKVEIDLYMKMMKEEQVVSNNPLLYIDGVTGRLHCCSQRGLLVFFCQAICNIVL